MKKKALSMLLSLVMVFAMVISVQAASKKKAFKSYVKWIQAGCKDENEQTHSFDRFYLAIVDSDKVPELVACKKLPASYGAMEDICVVSFKNNRIVRMTARSGAAGVGGFRGSFSYIPEKGKLCVWSISSGTGSEYNEIYKLSNNGFKKTVTAHSEYSYNYQKGKPSWSYIWNEKKVSKKTLEKKLTKAFNRRKAKSFADLPFVSKSAIVAMLR